MNHLLALANLSIDALREELEKRFSNLELDSQYADFLMKHTQVNNSDHLTILMESSELSHEFIQDLIHKITSFTGV